MTHKTEFKFVGKVHRKSQRPFDIRHKFTRHYKALDNAVVGMTRFMLNYGYVGDVCEIYSLLSGRLMGTVRVTTNGKLKTDWVWEN